MWDFLKYFNAPMIAMIIGSSLVCIFGFICSVYEEKSRSKKLLYWGSLFGGLIVLCSGVWGSTKESKNMDLLNTKNEKIIALSNENARLNTEIKNLVTGGDSFCYIRPLPDEISDRQVLFLEHKGNYPLYNISIRITNQNIMEKLPFKQLYDEIMSSHHKDEKMKKTKRRDLWGETMKLREKAIFTYNLPSFSPNTMIELLRYPLLKEENQDLIVQITTRNGYFYQRIKQKRFDKSWKTSFRVTDDKNNVLIEQINDLVKLD